jgi:tRNA A37 methylthiotransferase MiaB
MRDIVLVNPVSVFDQRHLPNLGLAAINSYLLLRGRDSIQIDMPDIMAHVDEAEVFGISVWDHNYLSARQFTHSLKRHKPNATVIWGGWAAMATPQWMLEQNPGVDYVVLQDGERRVEQLLDHLRAPGDGSALTAIDGIVYRGGDGSIIQQPVASYFDLDQLPVPQGDDHQRVRRQDGQGIVYVELARGCYGRCAYCQHVIKMRFRDPVKVAEEIAFWHAHGAEEFYIGNDNSIANVKLLAALIDELERRRVHIRIWLTGRPNDVMKGLHVVERVFRSEYVRPQAVEMGIESNSQAMLDKLRRGLTPALNRRAMDALMRLRAQYSPETKINANIILFPHWDMTLDDFAANVQFIGDYGCSRETMSLQLYGVPGTPLWDEMLAKGFASTGPQGRRVVDYPFTDPEVEALFDTLIRQPREQMLKNPFLRPERHYQFQYEIHDRVMAFYRSGDIAKAARAFVAASEPTHGAARNGATMPGVVGM